MTQDMGRQEKRLLRLASRVAAVSALALVLANCASQNQVSSNRTPQQMREIGAFSAPKYGRASPRVVGMDDAAPKGGGRYQVGRPYVIAGKRYVPREKPEGFTQTGNSSWYGIAFHGRKTANGEIYDRNMISAAHPTMPLPSYARVTNTRNNHSIIVRVNDRGPYHGGRVIDVSERTANLLNFKHLGTARVRIDYMGPAALAGSDDQRLMASLRTNGPANVPGGTSGPVMVASADPVASAVPRRAQPMQARAIGFAPEAQVSTAPAPISTPGATNSGVVTATRFTPAPELPVPPARPFDLETIGGAAQPVAPAGLPKAAPVELALSDTSGLLTRFGRANSGEQHWLKTPLQRVGEGN
ncbi:MAG: septal ring lytic transglycosylase RlpA family protein [Rhabdaerophilum sp.]